MNDCRIFIFICLGLLFALCSTTKMKHMVNTIKLFVEFTISKSKVVFCLPSITFAGLAGAVDICGHQSQN
jgi:hypothetical protein